MKPQFKIALFIISLVALIAFQGKAFMPFVHDVISSDLFLEETKDPGDIAPVTSEMTQFAFQHCNQSVEEELGDDFSVTFPQSPVNAWAIGNYQYVINAEIEIIPSDAQSFPRKYACRIKYSDGEDLTGIAEIDNWSLEGLSGLNDL